MKNMFLIFGCFCINICFAQHVLIPYRAGNLYGLSDSSGNFAVTPQYDYLTYLKGYYFQFTKATGTKPKSYQAGLMRHDTVLIPAQNLPYFLIYDDLIFASKTYDKPEQCMAYNLAGKKLLHGNVQAAFINHENHVGKLGTLSTRYSLLSMYHSGPKGRLFSIAVYDRDLQRIDKWLMYKVRDFGLDWFTAEHAYLNVLCKFTDAKGKHTKYMRFVNDTFDIADKAFQYQDITEGDISIGNVISEEITGEDITPPITIDRHIANKPEELSEKELESRGLIYYKVKGDTLFYVRHLKKEVIRIPDGVQLLYYYKVPDEQRSSIIYRQKSKYGLLAKGNFTEAKYDSIQYFGGHFIVYKKTGVNWQCGILDRYGDETVPLIYDSIQGPLKDMDEERDKSNNNSFHFIIRPSYETSQMAKHKMPYIHPYSSEIVVFKNGKSGLIGLDHQIYLPVAYDMIVNNRVGLAGEDHDNFIILKRDGLYGVGTFKYDYTFNRNLFLMMVEPVLKDIPLYYEEDYFGKNNFRLYALFDAHFNFKGYAHKSGLLYYKD